MFSKIIIAVSALFIGTASGVAASTAMDDRSEEKSYYEMPTYKWDPEAQTNVFVGYRKIYR
ncbi:hypothetical protein [Breoghania sp.]|uniref:hypothetical protein n=1 Tax=Breoghania sp. TaxID=2065378 RepID=UPI002AA66710|nr:hypothetical protein [Breoghania sp.]